MFDNNLRAITGRFIITPSPPLPLPPSLIPRGDPGKDYIFIMKSIGELQKKVENLTDEINDIFHATTLNLEALSVQLQPYHESKVIQGTLAQCQKEFDHIQSLFRQRASLRLEYLITEQIKEEEAKVRRERLVEYEEKIYDQRRLISDKQAFYEALLKPRRKRPAHITVEQFQLQRKQEIIIEDRKNLKRLEEETNELKQIEKYLKHDNTEMQNLLARLEKEDIPDEQLDNLNLAINQNPSIYDNLAGLPARKDDKDEIKKFLENIAGLEMSNDQLHKQYLEEKELHQYLKWEHAKLKAGYIQKNEQKLANDLKNRKKMELVAKYKIKRSLSI